jgi:hypothetical protein
MSMMARLHKRRTIMLTFYVRDVACSAWRRRRLHWNQVTFVALGFVIFFFFRMSSAASEDVFSVWEKCKQGDRMAFSSLTDLGPDASAISEDVLLSLFEDTPLLPQELKWELLESFEADGVPSVIASMEGLSEDQQLIVLEHLQTLGRYARPGLPWYRQQLQQDDDEKRLLLCNLIAECSPTSAAEITRELIAIIEAPETYGPNGTSRAIQLLGQIDNAEAIGLLRKLAMEDERADVRQQAIFAMATGANRKYAPNLLIDKLEDVEFVNGTPSYQATNGQLALRLLGDIPSLPEEIGSRAVTEFYRSTFDESASLNPDLMWQIISNSERLSLHACALITSRILPLLKDDAWISAHNGSPRQTKIAAAAIVLFGIPQFRTEAKEFLLTELARPDHGDMRAIAERTMAARVLCILNATEPADADLLRRVTAETSSAQHLELRICAALALAAADPDDVSLLPLFRDDALVGILDKNRIPLEKLQQTLGPRCELVWQFRDLIRDFEMNGLETDSADPVPLRLLSQLFPEEMSEYLVQRLKSREADVVVASLRLSNRIGSKSPQLMEAMTKRLRDNRSRIQAAAAEALGGCGASAAESLPELRRSLTSKSLTVQIAAQDAIARIEQF